MGDAWEMHGEMHVEMQGVQWDWERLKCREGTGKVQGRYREGTGGTVGLGETGVHTALTLPPARGAEAQYCARTARSSASSASGPRFLSTRCKAVRASGARAAPDASAAPVATRAAAQSAATPSPGRREAMRMGFLWRCEERR